MKIDKLSGTAFAEFGEVISTDGTNHFPINNGTTERYHDLANIDVAEQQGKPLVNIFRGQPRRFPFEVTMMERHPIGSQAFIPLSRNPYLIVVSPRGDFQPRDLRAFLANPGQGVNYSRGTWHHALIALGEISDFIVIDRGGAGANCDEMPLPHPLIISEQDVAAVGFDLREGNN